MSSNSWRSVWVTLGMALISMGLSAKPNLSNDESTVQRQDSHEQSLVQTCGIASPEVLDGYRDITHISELLAVFGDAAVQEKLLYIDQKYTGCLGCMNITFGQFMHKHFRKQKDVISATLLYQQGNTISAQQTFTSRIPYQFIKPTPAYMLLNLILTGKQQRFNHGAAIERYPLVTEGQRDCPETSEPSFNAYCQQSFMQTFKEQQAQRQFTRHHFPNLLFIDGQKIDQSALLNLCVAASNNAFELIEDKINPQYLLKVQNGIQQQTAISDAITALLSADDAILLQLLNFNLYETGSETAEDLLDEFTIRTLGQLLAQWRQTEPRVTDIDVYTRPGYEMALQQRLMKAN